MDGPHALWPHLLFSEMRANQSVARGLAGQTLRLARASWSRLRELGLPIRHDRAKRHRKPNGASAFKQVRGHVADRVMRERARGLSHADPTVGSGAAPPSDVAAGRDGRTASQGGMARRCAGSFGSACRLSVRQSSVRRSTMCRRSCAELVVLGVVLISLAGCDGGTPPRGARAVVPADHLDEQQARLERRKEKMRSPSTSRPARRPLIGA
jgi:hypothetical protein